MDVTVHRVKEIRIKTDRSEEANIQWVVVSATDADGRETEVVFHGIESDAPLLKLGD